jgi:Carboxypeptidase regulatory-like domain/TonB dependent receptor
VKTSFKSFFFSTLCLTILFTFAPLAPAQETTGSISGTITDPSGAAIKGATVVLTNTDRGQDVRTLTTNSSGFYTGTSLPLGTYTVKVSMNGFKTEAVTGLVLHANDALTVNRTMVVGDITETVTVTAGQVQLNLENGMSQGLIDGTQVRELVLNNRNYEQLLVLQPGVSYGGASDQLYIGNSLPSGTSNTVAFSINGSRPTSNNWTIDGADNVDRGANLTLLTYPSIDAISEFKTLRGTYSAEFGRNASGQINVITSSGTSSLHGSAYEFFRNDILNANRYFNNFGGVSRPLLRYNDFGYTVGGPVYIPGIYTHRDKTFFFWSQEFRRIINYAAATALLPTSYERTGDFSNAYYRNSAGATVQGPIAVCTAFTQTATSQTCTAYGTKVTGFSPTAQSYLTDIYNKLPVPNSAGDVALGLDPHAYSYNQRNVFNNTQEFVRIDHSLTQHINLFYRYLHDSLPSQEAGGLFNGANAMPLVPNTLTLSPGTQHLGHVTWVMTSKLLMDVGYAFSYGAIVSTPVGLEVSANSPDIKPNLPYGNPLGVIPSISSSGITSIASAGLYNDYNRNHNAFGNVTYTWGLHTFKAGVTYNHYQKSENATGNGSPYPQGIFSFSGTAPTAQATAAQATAACGTCAIPGTAGPGLASASWANFLLGNANAGFTQGSAALTPDIRENLFEVYLQDDWKVSPRLTLNLGVRYSYFAQPTDALNRMSNFDPSTYNRANAPVVTSTGIICKAPATTCANTNGLSSNAPNPNADFINGIILGTPGSNGHPSSYGSSIGSTQSTNFAPRVGFAYDVYGNGKTAFRGGFGTAYDQSQVSIYETPIFGNLPYASVPSIPVATLDNPAGGTASISTAIPSLNGSPLNYRTPYTMQYSLDIQQQVTPSFVLDVGYFGSMGRHLQGKVDINTLPPGSYVAAGISPTGACSTGFTSETCEQQLNQIRPYVGYKAISVVRTIFSSNYNGLQIKAQKRFKGKSYFDANYTWSRALTNSQADYSAGPQNIYNINGDYGRAVYDRTTIISLDGVYELPFFRDQKGVVGHVVGGWELSGLYAIDSGLPLTVSMSGGGTICYACVTTGANAGASQTSIFGLASGGVANDSAGLGIIGPSVAGLRPNMVANPNNGYGQKIHTRLNWFYRPAFVSPAITDVAVGNEKRGVIEGPGFNRLDVGIFRNFKLLEGVAFQLRGEAFNVANHTNWQTVGTTSTTSSTFGQITDTRDPRILQVAGKLTF